MKLNLADMKLSLNQMKLNMGDIKLSPNQMKLSLGETKLSPNQTKLNLAQMKLPFGKTELPSQKATNCTGKGSRNSKYLSIPTRVPRTGCGGFYGVDRGVKRHLRKPRTRVVSKHK